MYFWPCIDFDGVYGSAVSLLPKEHYGLLVHCLCFFLGRYQRGLGEGRHPCQVPTVLLNKSPNAGIEQICTFGLV